MSVDNVKRSTILPRLPAPRVLYLDMNFWVAIARGCAKEDGAWLQVRDRLRQATRANQLVVPLSPAHYLELWHRRDNTSRRQVAELMQDISGYSTIPSPHVVRRLEAEGLVLTWTGHDSPMPTTQGLVGRGAAHAFGRPDGRFRFVASIASPDGEISEGRETEPPAGWARVRDHPGWEWFQLYGMDGIIPNGTDFDRTPEHRFGSLQLDHENRLRARLRSHPEARRRLSEVLIAEEFESIREYVENACHTSGVLPPERLRAGEWGPESAEAVRSLVQSVPSADVWVALRYLKHRDLNLPWEQHDWTDLWSLSVAIPYCDAVVTEKRWAHLATVSGLARRYGTSVGATRQAIEAELVRAEGL